MPAGSYLKLQLFDKASSYKLIKDHPLKWPKKQQKIKKIRVNGVFYIEKKLAMDKIHNEETVWEKIELLNQKIDYLIEMQVRD